MAHRFDATLKDIFGQSATDLAPVLHFPVHLGARALNVDLSTISAATDVAFGFGEPVSEIVDVNFQSGPDASVDSRLLLYSAAYRHRYGVPVRSILILLRPAADHPTVTGQLAYVAGESSVGFRYEVIRLWEESLEPFLTGGVALLPLAPLCALPATVLPEQALREVIHRIDERLANEVPHARAMKLMTAAFILTGMRVKLEVLEEVFRGVRVMYESSAFDLYEEKGRVAGRVEEVQRVLLRGGRKQFNSAPNPALEAILLAIRDLDRLERLHDALWTAHSWEELLATP